MKNLYRRSMLEKLSSPEQLDKLIVITKPSFWIALTGGICIAVLVILWSVFGTFPEKVTASGIYSPVQDISLVSSEVDGIVESVNVSAGDTVSKGDVLYTVNVSDEADGSAVTVTALADGTVSGINVAPGAYVTTGSLSAVIRSETQGHLIYCYVPVSEGKKIEKGMSVNVYPATVDSDEYGHMTATVTDVSSYVPTETEVLLQIGDQTLAEEFLEDGSVICVTCTLDEDASTASGYSWSGSKGAQVTLNDDTIVTADIITASKHPIELLFPGIISQTENNQAKES